MFNKDFSWQMKYYSQIEKILKANAMDIIKVSVADDHADMKEATDFVVTVRGGTVAVRIRRNVANVYDDITIRASRPNGSETELQKIKKGYADFYLYIWTMNERVIRYRLVDIEKMRKERLLDIPRKQIRNTDGTTFIAIAISELQKIGALIKEWKAA